MAMLQVHSISDPRRSRTHGPKETKNKYSNRLRFRRSLESGLTDTFPEQRLVIEPDIAWTADENVDGIPGSVKDLISQKHTLVLETFFYSLLANSATRTASFIFLLARSAESREKTTTQRRNGYRRNEISEVPVINPI